MNFDLKFSLFLRVQQNSESRDVAQYGFNVLFLQSQLDAARPGGCFVVLIGRADRRAETGICV